MVEVIWILCVFCCFLLVFGKDNYQVTVSYNATVTMNCSATTVIKILNITVNENSKCEPMDCILSEEGENAIKASCDEQHACYFTSNIPKSCLLDLGYLNYEYACKAIAHSCNFDNGWCDWTISPDADGLFRWKHEDDTTGTSGTGPLGDHTTGSGHYAYTEANRGILGDIAKLKSIGITSSPYQCLSFWYHMRGDDIGSLRVYQIYSTQDEDEPIWTVDGKQGAAWIYQAINLTYKNELFQIMFEGVRGDGRKGDIALDDIIITNSYCEVIPFLCNFDNNWCNLTSSPNINDVFRWKQGHGTTSTSGTGPFRDHTTGSGYYTYTEATRGILDNIAKLKSIGITSSPYQCLSFWYHMHGDDIGSLRVYQIYSTQDEDEPIWTVDGKQGAAWIYQAINLTYKNEFFQIMFEGVRGDGRKGDIALDDITITNSPCEDLRSRCQLSYSDQCTMNSNEDPLFEFKEECTEINQPISLSCSNQYLTVDHDEFIFDPELEFCHDLYMSSKTSLCNNTHDSEICTFNLHRIIQSYPECFGRYSMTIDYTCEANLHEKSSIVAAGILMILVSTLVFTIVASLVIIALVCYRKKRAKHFKTQQNTTTTKRINLSGYYVINYNETTDISIIKIHEKGNETHTTQQHPQNICTKYDSLSTDRNSVDHIYESCSIYKNQYELLTNQRESDKHTYESPEYKLQQDINTTIEQENTICNKYESLSTNRTSVEHIYESDSIHTNRYELLTRNRESDKHTYESPEPAQAQYMKAVIQQDQNICNTSESLSTNRNSDKPIYESDSIHTNRYESITIPQELYKHIYESAEHALPQDKKMSIE